MSHVFFYVIRKLDDKEVHVESMGFASYENLQNLLLIASWMALEHCTSSSLVSAVGGAFETIRLSKPTIKRAFFRNSCALLLKLEIIH